MALANFHDRAATAAAQIMQRFDLRAFERTLNRRLVGIAYDEAVERSPEARVTLELALNLLARLYPKIGIIPVGEAAQSQRVRALARAINPDIELVAAESFSACLVIGDRKVPKRYSPIYLGSDGWIAKLSASAPQQSGRSRNPFGAAAAACFGVANVFRKIFRENLPSAELDEEFRLSLLDQIPNSAAPENPPLREVDLGEVFLVGIGAIGNAAAWTLSRCALRGTLHLIDPEKVELTNLQRYVLATQRDVGAEKVGMAARRFKKAGLLVKPHARDWADFLVERNDWNLPVAAAALDSARDRIAVQASLPKYLINSWTQPGDLGISRHHFLGPNACLACLYMPDRLRKHEDQLIAEAIGWKGDIKEIRRRIQLGEPTDRGFLEAIANARSLPLEPLLRFEGISLREFYTQAICGGVLFQLTAGRDTGPALVPLAFQSALAGVLLAAEIVANGTGWPRPVETKTVIDLLSRLPPRLLEPRGKAPHGNCVCQDRDFVETWRAKYGVS